MNKHNTFVAGLMLAGGCAWLLACGDTPGGPASPDAHVDAADAADAADSAADAADLAADAADSAGLDLDAAPLPDAPPSWICPDVAAPMQVGMVTDFLLGEASGVAVSRVDSNLLWVNNDGGNGVVWALTKGGQTRERFATNVSTSDGEDIAVGPGPFGPGDHVYLGDVGDNAERRSFVRIVYFEEPTVALDASSGLPSVLSNVGVVKVEYPSGPHNCETLMVDSMTQDVYLVTKAKEDGVAAVFRIAAPLVDGTTRTAERVTELTFGVGALAGPDKVSGGDISLARDMIALRTGDTAFVWHWAPGTTMAEALLTPPCPIPLAPNSGEEAIGFDADGGGVFTLREGTLGPVRFYEFL